jgi:hypothetical protein
MCPCSAEERKAARPFVGDISETSESVTDVSAGLSEKLALNRDTLLGAAMRRRATTACGVYCPGGGVWVSIEEWICVRERV